MHSLMCSELVCNHAKCKCDSNTDKLQERDQFIFITKEWMYIVLKLSINQVTPNKFKIIFKLNLFNVN